MTERRPYDAHYAKPTPASDALCDFLGVSKGSQVYPLSVTQEIGQYCKNNDMITENRLYVKLDPALRTLFGLAETDTLMHTFDLHRLMAHHLGHRCP